jgi:hypothetical protein
VGAVAKIDDDDDLDTARSEIDEVHKPQKGGSVKALDALTWCCKLDKADFPTFLQIASYLSNLKVEREEYD